MICEYLLTYVTVSVFLSRSRVMEICSLMINRLEIYIEIKAIIVYDCDKLNSIYIYLFNDPFTKQVSIIS